MSGHSGRRSGSPDAAFGPDRERNFQAAAQGPRAHWSFDKLENGQTLEAVSGKADSLEGFFEWIRNSGGPAVFDLSMISTRRLDLMMTVFIRALLRSDRVYRPGR